MEFVSILILSAFASHNPLSAPSKKVWTFSATHLFVISIPQPFSRENNINWTGSYHPFTSPTCIRWIDICWGTPTIVDEHMHQKMDVKYHIWANLKSFGWLTQPKDHSFTISFFWPKNVTLRSVVRLAIGYVFIPRSCCSKKNLSPRRWERVKRSTKDWRFPTFPDKKTRCLNNSWIKNPLSSVQKPLCHSMKSWLVYRDPYGILIFAYYNPHISKSQPAFCTLLSWEFYLKHQPDVGEYTSPKKSYGLYKYALQV